MFSTGAFSDPDGDTLAYLSLSKDGSTLPEWLFFSSGERRFYGTPSRSDESVEVTLTSIDGRGGAASQDFTIGLHDWTTRVITIIIVIVVVIVAVLGIVLAVIYFIRKRRAAKQSAGEEEKKEDTFGSEEEESEREYIDTVANYIATKEALV